MSQVSYYSNEANTLVPDEIWGVYHENKRLLISQLYYSFAESIQACRTMMLKLQQRVPLNQIAWYARNLLELQIWVEFCSRNELNATSFYEDCIRDLVDINEGQGERDPQPTAALERAKTLLSGQEKPHKYKSVREAAKSLGAKDDTQTWSGYFKAQNKLLSKFVHPTSLSVVMALPKNEVRPIQRQFVKAGEEFAREGLKTLEASFIQKLHAEYAPRVAENESRLRREGKRVIQRSHFLAS